MTKQAINAIMEELAEYNMLIEEATNHVEELKNTIKEYMDREGVYKLIGENHKATWQEVTSARFDTATFKKANPELAEQYTKTATTRRFIFN